MSTALQRAKERYALTPRQLDPMLERKARGDRGCLFDIGSGLGILASMACLIASQAGIIPFAWTYAGIALWVTSYFLGTRAQSRSGEIRHAAITEGPLTPAVVVGVEEHLRKRANKRSGRALVLFALLPEGADFEVGERQRRLAGLLAGELPDSPALSDIRKVLGDEFCFDLVKLSPAHLEALGAGANAEGAPAFYLTRVVVDPEQIGDEGLHVGDALAIIAHLESGIAEAV